MLYSRVPRSSAGPSIVNVYWPDGESHCACFSKVATDCDVSSVESDSKKTRSPTLTTKSCWLPGVAIPAAWETSAVFAHPPMPRATARAPASAAHWMARPTAFVIPVPPLLPRYRTGCRSSSCVVKPKLLASLPECCPVPTNAGKTRNPLYWLIEDECGAFLAPFTSPRLAPMLIAAAATRKDQRHNSASGPAARCVPSHPR